MSENRRIRRYLLRRGDRKNLGTTYSDNKGIEYDYKWVAQMSSFFNVLSGCLKNGFPIVVPRLWYVAWAFYPFFFVRKDISPQNTIPILNHERIHIRQQYDIHRLISVPILLACLLLEFLGWCNPLWVLPFIPFVPTVVYGIEAIRSWVCLFRRGSKITFHDVRENTCFEREAVSRCLNEEYLFRRRFLAFLEYTGFFHVSPKLRK